MRRFLVIALFGLLGMTATSDNVFARWRQGAAHVRPHQRTLQQASRPQIPRQGKPLFPSGTPLVPNTGNGTTQNK